MIKVRGLTKTFNVKGFEIPAVRGVDLDVAPGEIVGFLGPNGAGKTTTLRMLSTLLTPTSGEAIVAGCDLLTDQDGVRQRIGYVGQGSGAGPEYRVAEELVTHGRLYGLSSVESKERVSSLLKRFDLEGAEDKMIGALSGGQKRRLDIVMGVMHRPQLVFLDEPSTGLDPHSRSNLWDHVRAMREQDGTTVFLTTHYLDEADALCDRILVIDAGAIVAEGTADELKQKVNGDLVSVESSSPEVAAEVAAKAPGAGEIVVEGPVVRFRIPRGDSALPGLLRDFDQAGVVVQSIQTNRPTLDDVFLTLTGRSLRDTDAATPMPAFQ
ncbi:ATP-binding cassette domain-containing protein [Nonomuraea sp. NBC_01738]|uniref:ATP-binding cassette domain-containing protein n=1 Tax=Nonomuraea sp. NBC_01738 TaxID=2976003 RepID=UPI002E118C32|nr:ATP-binding cassette domain-containing protein [Nonomuraea sp. NBC_01738]